jgi:hypothetical protein
MQTKKLNTRGKMKITEEFIEHSIFGEFVLEACVECDSNEFFTEIANLIFEHADSRLKEYPDAVQHLKSRKYASARSAIDRFDSFHSRVLNLRRTLRSLISGIVITSAITDHNAIADYKNKWKSYDNNEGSKDPFSFHHQVIYQQFKKVNSLQELAKFNEYFHEYLVEMAFKLAEIFIRRLIYTIDYFQDEEAFKEVCGEATLNLRNFRNEIEKLKRGPLDIYHGGAENTEKIF